MAKSKSKSKRAPVADAVRDPAVDPPKPPPNAAERWRERGIAYGLLALSAVLMFLGFAGFGVWPLAFIGMVPALYVFDREPRPTGWRFFWRALFFGYLAYYGGFYWVVNTIVDFGGFPYLLALFFASAYFLYQAAEFILILWLWRRARERGFNATLTLVAAYVGSELAFPMIFDHYYGNSFHMLPLLVQIADFGGPMLLTALAMLGNGALYEVVSAKLAKRSIPKVSPIVFVGCVAFAVAYSAFRIEQVEGWIADAPKIEVGVVQTNMGIFEKHEDPGEGLRRHMEQSLELEREHDLDLLIWPESAATFRLPRTSDAPAFEYFDQALAFYDVAPMGRLHTPLLFGGLSGDRGEERTRSYNTAFITDAEGRIQARYDKTYLLAFGEYIPLGESFPELYDASPNTSRFTPGNHVRPMSLGDFRISTLICYEDILPRFVRRAVREGDPHLLVNITNDAWFGETQEPYVHLALAKMRAIEHHRYLVRATNTGISAIVDPLGRVVSEGPLFGRGSLHGEVAMLEQWTPYETVGDWPGWLALGAIVYMAFVGRRRSARVLQS